ncbi:unnamed protein product [Urochloa decumbens]|uniref:Uncharacterized protein n=1 Tax=Urochloa decumbens TaxID=240449 RepID=A0ABC9AH63_9POAL
MEFTTGAFGTLLPKLGQLLQDEYNLQKCAKKNIECLKSELESIHAALRSVGEVPLEQLSELVRIWARDARELSYDMEDIVDTFMVRVQDADPLSKKRSKKFIQKMKDFVTKAKTQHEIGQEIKNINQRVMELAKRRKRYEFAATTPKTCEVDPRIASLYTKAADLVGINEASKELIMRITKEDDTPVQKQRTVSIVGFGGLGKTTLAKALYDDDLKGQFDCTAFVPVGRTPDLKKFFKDMLIKLDKPQYMNFNFGIFDYARQFIDELRDFLKNKRYFIVIDDIWDTDSWRTIKLALDDNNRGSRVIITTRTHEVAREAGGIYELQPLSHDNSRKLFFRRIFGSESKPSNRQPDDEVSDKILRKCGGIPLAIITMASLLVGKPREEWLEVHRSIGFGNEENQQVMNTMKILSFSYYDLPTHLRACLLYLSVFPEDYFIIKDNLIWMWIAEGFVHKKQRKSLFEVGEEYFNELVNKNMIQLVEEFKKYDPVHGCQVHDMVLDLIRSISSKENFVTVLDSNEGASSSSRQGKVRRLALQTNMTMQAHVDMQQVRSFISYGFDINKGVPFLGFKLIRVLAIGIASPMDIKSSHVEHIQYLLHLRYLQLSGYVFKLPEGIGSLKFLQTLDADGYFVQQGLTSVSLLTQLLCLRFKSTPHMVLDGIGKLTSLQELQITICYDSREEEAYRRFVKELCNLRELRVLRIEMGGYMELIPYMVECLRNLEKMEHLTLSYVSNVDTAKWKAADFLLSHCLRQLFLGFTIFSRLPSFCVNALCLPNLSHLTLLLEYIDEQDLRILGGLPELRCLSLDVKSTTEVVSNTESTTYDIAGDGKLFQKLRRCILRYFSVRVLSSKDDDSGSISFRLRDLEASMLLRCQSDKSVALTLMPSAQRLEFYVHAKEFMISAGCGSLSLEYFASVRNVVVIVDCAFVTTAVVEEVEGALRHVADVHPNCPTLEVRRAGVKFMIPSDQDQEVSFGEKKYTYQKKIEQQQDLKEIHFIPLEIRSPNIRQHPVRVPKLGLRGIRATRLELPRRHPGDSAGIMGRRCHVSSTDQSCITFSSNINA